MSLENRPGCSKTNFYGKAGEKRKGNLQENKAPKRQKLQENDDNITEDLLPKMSIVKLHTDRLGISKGMSPEQIKNKIVHQFGAINIKYENISFKSFRIWVFVYGSNPKKNIVLEPFKCIQPKKIDNQVENAGQITSGTLIVWFRKLEDGAPEIFCVYKGAAYKKLIPLADYRFRTSVAKRCLDQNYVRRYNYVTISGPAERCICIYRTARVFDNCFDAFERVYTDLEGQVIKDCKLHKLILHHDSKKKLNIDIGQYKVRIQFCLTLSQVADILSYFSDVCRNGFGQTDNFSFLDLVKREDNRNQIKTLDQRLLERFLNSIKDGGISSDLSLSHNYTDDWALSSEINLIWNNEEKATWYSTPSLEEVKTELKNISVDKTNLCKNINKKKIQIQFQKKNENEYECKPLQTFVHGTITDGDETYYKISGKWFKFTIEYSDQVDKAFSELVVKLLRENQIVSRLLLPWSHRPRLRLKDLVDFFNLSQDKAEDLMNLFEENVTFVKKNSKISKLKGVNSWFIESSQLFKMFKKEGLFKTERNHKPSKKFMIEQSLSESCENQQDLNSVEKGKKLELTEKEKAVAILSKKVCLIKKQGRANWKVINPNMPTSVLRKIKNIPANTDRLALFFRSFCTLTENEYSCNYFMQHNRKHITTIYGDKVLVNNVELFDVLIHDPTYTNKTTYLLHVKKGLGQTTRDACSQIRISSQFIWKYRSNYQSEENYINLFWKTATKYKGNDSRRHKLKKKLKEIGKDHFLGFFDKDVQIVFVLAFMDAKKDKLSSELKSTIAKMEILYLNNYFKNYVSDGGYSFQLQVCQIPSEFK